LLIEEGSSKPCSYEARERVLVAHAPTLQGGSLVAIPARVLAYGWHSQNDIVTVAVKCSAAFDPVAAGVTRASWTTPALFDPRCDLVPSKRQCDVLVSGSSSVPPRPSGYGSGMRAAEIRIGDVLALRFFVDARTTGRVPLDPERVADERGVPGLQLGPANVGPPARLLHHDQRLEGFQCMPAAHRIALGDPVERVVLSGLLDTEDPLTIVLPETSPRVLVDPAWSSAQVQELNMYLDTITIAFDRAAIDLVWRGVYGGTVRSVDRLILGFGIEEQDEEEESYLQRWTPVLRELSRGQFYYAWELDDAVEGRAPPDLDHAHLTMAQLEGWEFPVAPTPQVTLEKYARVTAELGEGRDKRELVLAKHGFDEASWAIEERAWGTQLAVLPDGEDSQPRRYSELVIKCQDELAAPEEQKLGVADYAALAVKMERSEPAKVLSDARMSQGAYMRLERRIGTLAKADAAVQAELEREIAAAREREPFVKPEPPPIAKEALK